MRARSALRTFILLTLVLATIVLSGCSRIASRIGSGLRPDRTPESTEPAATRAVELPPLPSTEGTAPSTPGTPSQPGEGTSVPSSGVIVPATYTSQDLLFIRGSSVMRGGPLGEDATEVVTLRELDAWDLYDTRLAAVQGSMVHLIDVRDGSQSSYPVTTNKPREYASVIWGESGQRLLHVAMVADPEAPTFGRSVELRVVDAQSGAVLGVVALSDVSGATVLRFDDSSGQALIVPRGGDPSFAQVGLYDLLSGQLISLFSCEGQGEAALSPDGTRLLTTRLTAASTELLIYDPASDEGDAPLFWEVPAGTRVARASWSPDGTRVAYSLVEGEVVGADVSGLVGPWMLDLQTMQTWQVLDDDGTSSQVVGWTPNGSHILVYHGDSTTGSHYYVVRPDGGDMRILPVDPESHVLGWIASDEPEDAIRIAVDPWQGRFLDAAQDDTALANVIAAFVAERSDADVETLTTQLTQYLAATGRDSGATGFRLIRLSDSIFAAKIPSASICVFERGTAQQIAQGDLLIEARLDGDALGVIYGIVGSSAVQPAFLLLTRSPEGPWATAWAPTGQRDWIATDGQIEFVGQGLELVRVTGTSFGLDYALDSLFTECHACPHRSLTGTWARSGDGYARVSDLPATADQADVLWEMTVRTPYAVVYEAFTRLSAGQPIADLVSGTATLQALQNLDLARAGARFMPESESDGQVDLLEVTSDRRFRATVEDAQIVAFVEL